MTIIAAIRTHRWDEDAIRLHGQLAPVFGPDLVIAFHDRPEALTLPGPVVDLNEGWVAGQGLRVLPDWGWRCGDYFLYAVRQARPDASFIWLVEPDVFFTGPAEDFFARFRDRPEDLLGVDIARLETDHRFVRGLPGLAPWKSIFALTRFSAAAADRLFARRQDYSRGPVGPRFFTNDELFCFSHGVADPELTTASMKDIAPDWLPEGALAGDPDLLVDLVAAGGSPVVRHPVRARATFIDAVAARAIHNFGFLRAMRDSLRLLSETERRQLSERVAEGCLDTITRLTRG